MLRLLSNVTYPGHARLATDRRLLEGDNWNCGCDGANRDEHLTLEARDPPLGTRQNYTKVSDQFWPVVDRQERISALDPFQTVGCCRSGRSQVHKGLPKRMCRTALQPQLRSQDLLVGDLAEY